MELAGIIISALSFLATALTFICEKILGRKHRTLGKINELKNHYHNVLAGKDKKEGTGPLCHPGSRIQIRFLYRS